VESDPDAAGDWIKTTVGEAFSAHLGFAAAASVSKA